MQISIDPNIKLNYYQLTQFNSNYKIDNVEIRSIVWREDIYKNQILVGSPITISNQQAQEHKLVLSYLLGNKI